MNDIQKGIEAFNRGDFWQAHEDWERLWHKLDGEDKLWLQGLIQAAAVFYHLNRGSSKPALRLAKAALEKLDGKEESENLNLKASGLIEVLQDILATESAPPQAPQLCPSKSTHN